MRWMARTLAPNLGSLYSGCACYFLSGSTTVFDEPSGVACMPGAVSPRGLEAGAPPGLVLLGAGPALRLQLTLRLGSNRAAGAGLGFVRVFVLRQGLRPCHPGRGDKADGDKRDAHGCSPLCLTTKPIYALSQAIALRIDLDQPADASL